MQSIIIIFPLLISIAPSFFPLCAQNPPSILFLWGNQPTLLSRKTKRTPAAAAQPPPPPFSLPLTPHTHARTYFLEFNSDVSEVVLLHDPSLPSERALSELLRRKKGFFLLNRLGRVTTTKHLTKGVFFSQPVPQAVCNPVFFSMARSFYAAAAKIPLCAEFECVTSLLGTRRLLFPCVMG